MTSVSGYFNDVTGVGQAGYGLYNQLDRALHGDSKKVHFVQGNVTVVEFDLVLNEGHSFTVAPTSFPIESGSVISDHTTVSPIQINLTAVISDYPVETRQQLTNSLVATAITAPTSAVGALATVGALGGTVGYTSLVAQKKSQSRSVKVFDDLQKLAGFSTDQRPNVRPQTFDIITRLRRYPSMMITSMQLNRDSTSGPSNIVFTLSLQQVQIAYARTALVRTSVPAKAGQKQKLGEGDSQTDRLNRARAQGQADAHATQDPSTSWIVNHLPGS